MQYAHGPSHAQPLPTGALATFIAIERHGSISAAAQALHLSQPATSRRLQGLEEQIGVALFDRIAGRLHITAAGLALLPHAEQSIAAEADAVRAAQAQGATAVGNVDLAIVGSLIDPLLTRALEVVVREHPDAELHISTATSAHVCSLVRKGEVALGVSYSDPPKVDPVGDLHHEVLTTEQLVAVCAPAHSLAGRRIDAKTVGSRRWLVFPDHENHPESSSTIARRTLEQHQVEPKNLRSIDSLSAQRALVRAEYGLALLPLSMVADDITCGTLALVKTPTIQIESSITLTSRAGAYVSPAVQVIVDILRDAAASDGA